ncbi:gluconate 2-dehydrogenase subunit 3 family protein [Streptomyces tendae]|uniref:gluconate 2-dehydrogenase subunit 3 family protein n=1 Tax=Streptomyces tendae TaxID=1932 RepID=UPI003689E449
MQPFLEHIADRVFPPDESGPGGCEIGAAEYVARRLAGPRSADEPAITALRDHFEASARRLWGVSFCDLAAPHQDRLIEAVLAEHSPAGPESAAMRLLIDMTIEGIFADPVHGGNRGGAGWQLLAGMSRPPQAR